MQTGALACQWSSSMVSVREGGCARVGTSAPSAEFAVNPQLLEIRQSIKKEISQVTVTQVVRGARTGGSGGSRAGPPGLRVSR